MRRKLANHKMLHFRPFLAKTNDSILHKIPKRPFLDPFSIFYENNNFPKNVSLDTLECLWGPPTSCKISKKSNEPILSNIQKSYFVQLLCPLLLLFVLFWGKQAFLQKNDIVLNVLWYSIFMQKIIKNG